MLGKILNGLVEKAVDKWLGSESSKRYASSAIMRWGQIGMVALLALAVQHGLSEAGAKSIASHWTAILEIGGPVAGAALIEAASLLRARLNAKALEIAAAAPGGALTPADAKAMAKVDLAH